MRNIHFHLSKDCIKFLSFLKPILYGKANVTLADNSVNTVFEVSIRAKEKGATAVCTTSQQLLTLLLDGKKGTIDEYAGSIFQKHGLEFLILDPLEHLLTVPYGKHIYERYLSKLLDPSSWLQIPNFKWNLFQPKDEQYLSEMLQRATFIACDIETRVGDPDRVITCIGFTGVFFDTSTKSFTTCTVVVPFGSTFELAFARKILSTKCPKVFQNGKYDIAYLLRYNAIPTNWAYDTINMFHAWYSELPKDLGFITAYLLRDWKYHKNDNDTSDLMKHYEYNARDAFTTAMDCLTLLLQMPEWAWKNYLIEFPLVFPCVLAEATGIRSDEVKRKEVKQFLETKLEVDLARLKIMVANPFYNPSSHVQNGKLFEVLGCKDISDHAGTGKIPTDKAKARHPLNDRILSAVEQYKKDVKSAGTYFKDSVCWENRIFYAINPHGTDTGRMASKASQYWCGLQIQNIPRDNTNAEAKVKEFMISDEGFYLGECDYSQAETWGTAYLSGDPALLRIIHDKSKDFHSYNASAFFGLEYSAICKSVQDIITGEWDHERLDKPVIDIAKRNNHGANYNMGPGVLLDTMGVKNVARAQLLLNLPRHWRLKQVCEYILNNFDKVYPVIRGPWFDKVKSDVKGSGFLVSPFGWSRFCFSDPNKSKHALNSYVAHPPQNLNAGFVNEDWMKVFYKVWMLNSNNFKLNAQVHDCILFQYRIGHEYLAKQVKDIMEATAVRVTDTFGVSRLLRVPVDCKGGATRWSDLKKLKFAA